MLVQSTYHDDDNTDGDPHNNLLVVRDGAHKAGIAALKGVLGRGEGHCTTAALLGRIMLKLVL